MRKVELTQAEIAAVVALVDRAIEDAILSQRKAKVEYASHFDIHFNIDGKTEAFTNVPPVCDSADLDYWTEQLHMLRALKAKLERDEEDEPDEPREEDST